MHMACVCVCVLPQLWLNFSRNDSNASAVQPPITRIITEFLSDTSLGCNEISEPFEGGLISDNCTVGVCRLQTCKAHEMRAESV